jgi:hypothetical protein
MLLILSRPRRSAWPCLSLPMLVAGTLAIGCARAADAPVPPPAASATRPALTVTTVAPQRIDWPQRLSAAGNVAAWQEAVIGSELGGLRLIEVAAQVGDRVRRGQLLALPVGADPDQRRTWPRPRGPAWPRRKPLQAEASGQRQPGARAPAQRRMISAQQIAASTSPRNRPRRARRGLAAARAWPADEVRLTQTRIVAPG